jgi:hypothetical protein
MSDGLDNLWIRIHKFAGKCAGSADLEDLTTAVETAQSRIGKALTVGKFLQQDSKVFEKLTAANEKIGLIGKTLRKGKDLCKDVVAVEKIRRAVAFLKDENVIYNDPEGAAHAFGLMFAGFGRLCRYLPPPAKQWGKFLEEMEYFFVNVGRGLSPGKVGGYRDQWNQVEWEYVGGGRPK